MSYKPQIVLNEFVPGVAVPLGHALQAVLFLLPGQGPGEGPGVVGQPQGEKESVEH